MMNIFKGYLGRSDGLEPKTEDEELEILYNRVKTSSNLKDRREAVSTILAIAAEQRTKIGTGCIEGLLQILEKDISDETLASTTLQLLALLCAKDQRQFGIQPSEKNLPKEEHGTEGSWLTFSKNISEKSEYVDILMRVLRNPSFYLRYNAIKLLRILSMNSLMNVQESILGIPNGTSRIVELLEERRDMIRNEALLVLLQITSDNPEIQKVVAYDGVLDYILGIIKSNGVTTDNVAVSDSLKLMLNLIQKNPSIQTLVCEPPSIRIILQMLTSEISVIDTNSGGCDENTRFSNIANEKKMDNLCLLLDILYILADHRDLCSTVNKKIVSEGKLLQVILYISVFCNPPEKLQIQLLRVLSEFFRNDEESTNYAINLTPVGLARDLPASMSTAAEKALSSCRQRVLYYLLSKATDMRQGVVLSMSAASAFLVLISNEIAIKSQLLREARDHSGDTNEKISLGSPALLLLDTLITEGSRNYLPVLLPAIRVLYSMTTVDSLIEKSSGDRKRPQEKEPFDEYTVWIACTIISSLIADNAECKSIAMSICVNGASLFQLATLVLVVPGKLLGLEAESARNYSTIGILCLLSIWISGFPAGAAEYLKENTNVEYLVEIITNARKDLMTRSLSAFLYGVLHYECQYDQDVRVREKLYSLLSLRKAVETCCDLIEEFPEFVPETLDIRSFLKKKGYSKDKISDLGLIDMHFVKKFFAVKDQIVNFLMTPPTFNGHDTNKNKDQMVENYKILQDDNTSVSNLNRSTSDLKEENERLRKKLDEMTKDRQDIIKEHEDLLILFANYHQKVAELKDKLKSYNYTVSDDDIM